MSMVEAIIRAAIGKVIETPRWNHARREYMMIMAPTDPVKGQGLSWTRWNDWFSIIVSD